MLSFINYKEASEQIEIVADEQGLDDLIMFLQSVKQQKDHMHLTVGNELDNYPIPEGREKIVSSVKQVRVEYTERSSWP